MYQNKLLDQRKAKQDVLKAINTLYSGEYAISPNQLKIPYRIKLQMKYS